TKDAQLSVLTIAIAAIVSGVIWQAMVAGAAKRRAIVFVASGVATAALLVFFNLTDWYRHPGLGPIGIIITSVAVAVLITGLLAGFQDRRAMLTGLINAAAAIAAYFGLQWLFNISTWNTIIILGLGAIAFGIVSGWLVGGDDRRLNMRIGAAAASPTSPFVLPDRPMQSWPAYSTSPARRRLPTAPPGPQTPSL